MWRGRKHPPLSSPALVSRPPRRGVPLCGFCVLLGSGRDVRLAQGLVQARRAQRARLAQHRLTLWTYPPTQGGVPLALGYDVAGLQPDQTSPDLARSFRHDVLIKHVPISVAPTPVQLAPCDDFHVTACDDVTHRQLVNKETSNKDEAREARNG